MRLPSGPVRKTTRVTVQDHTYAPQQCLTRLIFSSFCSNKCVGLSRLHRPLLYHTHTIARVCGISMDNWYGALQGGRKKGGVTLTSLTRQCYPQSHTDHQTRLPNSTNETKKIPVVGMCVGVCVCVREVGVRFS